MCKVLASTSSHSPNTINSWSVIPWRNRDYFGISGWILLARVPRSANSPMCGGWYNRNAIKCQFAGPLQSCQLDRVAPVRLVLARPFRNQGRSDHHTIVAERLDLAIKPVSISPTSKQTCSRSYRSASLLIVRSIGNGLFSTSPRNRTSPTPAAFRDRDGVLLLGDIKSHKNFAMLSHGPPSVHEARLRFAQATLVLNCTKGRATGSAPRT